MSRALKRQYPNPKYVNETSPQASCVWPIGLWEIEEGGQPAQEDHQKQTHSLQPFEKEFNSDQLQSYIPQCLQGTPILARWDREEWIKIR